MNTTLTEDGQHRLAAARATETGQKMTDVQFEEVWAVAGIMDRSIRATGVFKDKLVDFAHAYARTQKFGSPQAETIIRDIYEERYGETMNDRRKALVANEEGLGNDARADILRHARDLKALIAEGETMPLYRAIDLQATALAEKYDISEAGAKRTMAATYKQAGGTELYADMKAVEDQYHTPKAAKTRSQARSRQDSAPKRSLRQA
jgi:hypothetical protein